MKRIVFHWAVDRGTFNASAAKHYHFYADKNGVIHNGKMKPEDNLNCRDGRYAAHTRGTNTESIGIACGGMYGAKSNNNLGPCPVTKESWMAAARKTAELCLKYEIAVTPRTVLTHAEVQGTLGIKQRGKWDYTVVPWKPTIRGAKAAGDQFRSDVKRFINDHGDAIYTKPQQSPKKKVDRNRNRYLQKLLTRAGYPVGDLDGWVGEKTKRAIEGFCADCGLDYNPADPFSKEVVAKLREQEKATRNMPVQAARDLATQAGAEGRTSTTEVAQGVAAVSGAGMPVATFIKDSVPEIVFTGMIVVCFALLVGGVVWTIKERRKYKKQARQANYIMQDVENEVMLLGDG